MINIGNSANFERKYRKSIICQKTRNRSFREIHQNRFFPTLFKKKTIKSHGKDCVFSSSVLPQLFTFWGAGWLNLVVSYSCWLRYSYSWRQQSPRKVVRNDRKQNTKRKMMVPGTPHGVPAGEKVITSRGFIEVVSGFRELFLHFSWNSRASCRFWSDLAPVYAVWEGFERLWDHEPARSSRNVKERRWRFWYRFWSLLRVYEWPVRSTWHCEKKAPRA